MKSILSLFVVLIFASPVLTQTEEEKTNLKTYQLWEEEVWGKGKLELVKQLVAPEYIRHEPTGDRVVIPEQYAEEIRKYRKMMESNAFTNKRHAISAKGDLVWIRSSVKPTDSKAGNKGSIRAIQVYRFVNGRLAETWWLSSNDQGPWPDFDR